jgi:hypothetical protein
MQNFQLQFSFSQPIFACLRAFSCVSMLSCSRVLYGCSSSRLVKKRARIASAAFLGGGYVGHPYPVPLIASKRVLANPGGILGFWMIPWFSGCGLFIGFGL